MYYGYFYHAESNLATRLTPLENKNHWYGLISEPKYLLKSILSLMDYKANLFIMKNWNSIQLSFLIYQEQNNWKMEEKNWMWNS